MFDYHDKLNELIKRVEENLQHLSETKENYLHQVTLPKSPGVYMLFFDGQLQYIGSSGNLNERIRANLIRGNRNSHTLINKLCELKRWKSQEAVNFLKSNATIKFVKTNTEEDAKVLEDTLISMYHTLYNIPLRKLKKTR